VLMALGPEASASLLRNLSDRQIEKLALEIANLRRVNPEEKRRILQEFYQTAQASEFVSQGGMDQARDLLEKALGTQRALKILDRVQGSVQNVPFDFIRNAQPGQIVKFIQDEHPQTMALIMAHLPHKTSALVLSELPQGTQRDVVRRIAIMDRISPRRHPRN